MMAVVSPGRAAGERNAQANAAARVKNMRAHGHVLEMSDVVMGVAWLAALETEHISDQWDDFWRQLEKHGSAKNPVTGTRMWAAQGYHYDPNAHAPQWVKKYNREKAKERAVKRGIAKLEALGGEVLGVPQPPPEIIPAGFAQRKRAELQTMTIIDIDIVRLWQRQLVALDEYFKDKRRRYEVRAAARYCEVRLGQLLGPATQGHRTDLV